MGWEAKASVQVMRSPDSTAPRMAARYFAWIHERLPLVTVRHDSGTLSMHPLGLGWPAIALEEADASARKVSYRVVGGYLVATSAGGDFSFELVPDGQVRIALQRFTPRLPVYIYAMTHALVHSFVMWLFSRHVEETVDASVEEVASS